MPFSKQLQKLPNPPEFTTYLLFWQGAGIKMRGLDWAIFFALTAGFYNGLYLEWGRGLQGILTRGYYALGVGLHDCVGCWYSVGSCDFSDSLLPVATFVGGAFVFAVSCLGVILF